MEVNHTNESTRLLETASECSPPLTTAKPQRMWVTILSAAAVLLVLNMGSYVSLAAQTTILQDIVCEDYYRQVQPDHRNITLGEKCKIDTIQSEVAYINGWKDVFEILPCRFAAFFEA